MRSLVASPLLTLGDDTWSYGDAVLLGLVTGRWTLFEQRVAQGIALEDEGVEEIPEADLEEAIVAWRRTRRLLAADDLKEWRSERALEPADVARCVRRSLLRERAAGRLRTVMRTHRPAAGRIADALRSEAYCDGTLADCAGDLILRAAAARALDGASAPPAEDPRLAPLIAAATAGPDRGFAALGRAKLEERARAVLALDVAHRQFSATAAKPEHLERHLRARRLELTRVRYEAVTLPTDSAAREAALCVQLDGLGLAQVAARASVTCTAAESELEAIEGPLRTGMAAGRPGELVGPIQGGDGFIVAMVRDRRAPTLDDAAVRKRIVEEVVGRQIARHAAGRVHWHACV